MTALTTYRGTVEKDGTVRLRGAPQLPAGTEVLVVVARLPSLEEQKRRLASLSDEEWRQPFLAVRAAWASSKPAPEEDRIPDDDGLTSVIHKARNG